MKLILVVSLLVCLLAINADGLYSNSGRFYWMSWRSTSLCIKTAAMKLSQCPGVKSNFHSSENWKGKRENEDGDNDKPEDYDVERKRNYEAVDAFGKAGNNIHSIRQPTE